MLITVDDDKINSGGSGEGQDSRGGGGALTAVAGLRIKDLEVFYYFYVIKK
jgi:hypothetical protein